MNTIGTRLTDEDLELLGERIVETAQLIDGATHRLLTDLRSFDEARGWRRQGAVSAAILSGPHNVIMAQKGFRSIGAADELPTHFPTSGLVVNETKLKSDAPRIKNVIRVMLDATAFCRKEKNWVVNYIKDRWKLEPKTAETVYDQWLSILTPDGKISIKDMQEYFDLAYSQKQIPAAINVAAVTDYSLLDQVLAGK